jgi:hypothetical protein
MSVDFKRPKACDLDVLIILERVDYCVGYEGFVTATTLNGNFTNLLLPFSFLTILA